MKFISKLHKISKLDLIAISIIILSSLILLVDTINLKGQPANMDGIVHVTNMAIFHDALRDGDFPVRWTDGFANYGLPMGSFSQQLTSYLGGFFTFMTQDPLVSFSIVYSLGTVVSALLFYWFARLYFGTWPSFVATILFNFAPYRIINLYIRGAIPEYFSTVFLLGILISLFYLFRDKKLSAWIWLVVSTAGLILSHPMNVITGSILFAPYLLFLLAQKNDKLKWLILSGSSFLFGLLVSAYYTIPLLKDIQYFFYGQAKNHFTPPGIRLSELFSSDWFYFITQRNEILSRGHFIKPGLIEILILGIFVFFILIRVFKKKKEFQKRNNIFVLVLFGSALLSLYLSTESAHIWYENINFLSNIQFPWRMLSTFMLAPPLLLAYVISYKNQSISIILGLVIILVSLWMRIPEVYSKNYTKTPLEQYYFTVDNLHAANMNPVWTGKTSEYPVYGDDKVAILEGDAEISNLKINNSKRSLYLEAKSDVRMIDRTFYYPGWHVYANGAEVPIEFQDPNYRGVITYRLPAGSYDLEIVFENTKTVLLGNLVSLGSVGLILLLLFKYSIVQSFLNKHIKL